MATLGAKAWYHPRWFSRYVPDPDIEGERLDDRLGDKPGDNKNRLTSV